MMNNKYLQGLTQEQINQMLANLKNTPEGAIVSAYTDEVKRWEVRLKSINTQVYYYETLLNDMNKKLNNLLREIQKIEENIKNKSSKFFNRFFNTNGKEQRKYDIKKEEYDKMMNEYRELNDKYKEAYNLYTKEYYNPPDINRYELALMGNSLFKVRK